jgi:hypothetical protein
MSVRSPLTAAPQLSSDRHTGGYRADGETRSARPCADDRGQRRQSSHESTAAYRVGNGRHAAHRLGIRAYAKRTTPSFRGQAVASAVEVRWVARLAPQHTEPSGLQRLVYGPRVAESACTGCFWHIASLQCDAEFGRYRGTADMAGLAAGSTRSRMTHSSHSPPAEESARVPHGWA